MDADADHLMLGGVFDFWNVNMDILDAKVFQQHKIIDFKDIKDIF